MMFRSTTTVLVIALVASCAADEEPGIAKAGATPKQVDQEIAARVEVATLGAIESGVTLERPGEVEGAREADLAAALGGLVERVLVKSGQTVKKNQVIAYIDSTVHAGEAKLTQVELDEATREVERLEKLGKAVASSRGDAARTRLARAKAQHSLSRTRQGRGVIRAPFAGVIVGLEVERGEVANPGAPIARLVQLTPAHVSVSVTDRDVGSLTVGSPAKVFSAASPQAMSGSIHRIEPAADRETRTFMVVVEVENADRRLLPGMMARVSFAGTRASSSLLIPQDFLVTQLDDNGVFVAGKNNTAEWRPLVLGSIVGTQVEVKSGVIAGDRVVVVGQRGLKAGDKLVVTREGMCCTAGRVTYTLPTTTKTEPSGTQAPTTTDRASAGEGDKK